MTNAEEKPFICYRRGWSMQIVPRNAAGWRALGLWVAALSVMAGLSTALLATGLGEGGEIVATIVFVAVSLVWALALIRWTMARSEIVEVGASAPDRDGRGKR